MNLLVNISESFNEGIMGKEAKQKEEVLRRNGGKRR